MTATEHGLQSAGPSKGKLGAGCTVARQRTEYLAIENEPLYVAALDARRDPSNPETHAFVEPFTTMTHSE